MREKETGRERERQRQRERGEIGDLGFQLGCLGAPSIARQGYAAIRACPPEHTLFAPSPRAEQSTGSEIQ